MLPSPGLRHRSQRLTRIARCARIGCACVLLFGCSAVEPPGPFTVIEHQSWRTTNRSHRGRDGIFVQATLRTFAYEISRLYAGAEQDGLDQSQLESCLREFVYMFLDGGYPVEDGTDINNLYYQYLVYVDSDFDPTNPIEKGRFDAWRGEYVRRLVDKIYDLKFPLLRHTYDERWGSTLFSRLVFNIYFDNTESELRPRLSDIGDRVFLVDDNGDRYRPSGTDGPYPYRFDRPRGEFLDGTEIVRLFFPNRKADRVTPIVGSETKYIELSIEGFGGEQVRRLRWDLPLIYPEPPSKALFAQGRPGSRDSRQPSYRKLPSAETDGSG